MGWSACSAVEWFHSLLQAVEAEDMTGRIEIHIYLTAAIKEDDLTNIMVGPPKNQA